MYLDLPFWVHRNLCDLGDRRTLVVMNSNASMNPFRWSLLPAGLVRGQIQDGTQTDAFRSSSCRKSNGSLPVAAAILVDKAFNDKGILGVIHRAPEPGWDAGFVFDVFHAYFSTA